MMAKPKSGKLGSVDLDLARAHVLSDMGRTAQKHTEIAAQHRADGNEGLARKADESAAAIEKKREELKLEWWGPMVSGSRRQP